MGARLVFRREGEVVVIDAYGKLATVEGRQSLRKELEQCVERGCRRFLLNLSDVPSLDTGEVGELVAIHAIVARAGGDLKLLNPRYMVEQVLRGAKLGKVLGIYPDEVSAMRSFDSPRAFNVTHMAGRTPHSQWSTR